MYTISVSSRVSAWGGVDSNHRPTDHEFAARPEDVTPCIHYPAYPVGVGEKSGRYWGGREIGETDARDSCLQPHVLRGREPDCPDPSSP